MQFRTPLLISTLCCAAALTASAEPAATAGPDNAAAVLAAMRQASGGDGWSRLHALHIVAEVASQDRRARVERWEDVAAGRWMSRTQWPTYLAQEGFDGVSSWRGARSGVPYVVGDVDSALVAADEAFRVSRGWWFPERHPATIAPAGVRNEGARSFDLLQVTPEGGRAFEAWIDRATHLLYRTVEQQAEDHVVTTYADYRLVQGVQLPFTVRTGDGGDPAFDEVETVQSVEVDPPVADSLYSLPARPASDIDLPKGRDRVEVPFRLTADNRIMVPLSLEGRAPIEAEFDSGGSLLLQPKAVAELGLQAAGRSKQTGGGEGSKVALSGRVGSVGLGGATVRGLAFHSLANHPDKPDEALVGLEILQRFVVGFDFDRRVMTLTRPDAFVYGGKGAIVPFHFQDNQPEIRGSIDGIAGLFAIDTGDNGSLLLIAPFARRYALVERYQGDLPYEGRSTGATHGVWARKRAGVVAFDGFDGRPVAQVKAPVTRISLQTSGFDANRNVSANIGLGILKQFNLTFDYDRQRLILEPNTLYGQKDVFNRAGLRLAPKGSAWTVSLVYDGGPAAEAGLKVGDVVDRVDGLAPDRLDADALRLKLLGPVGAKMVLEVHGRESRTVALTLRDIL